VPFIYDMKIEVTYYIDLIDNLNALVVSRALLTELIEERTTFYGN